ncbi:hypothetical protein [Fodinicurvata halophila]|uniref:hypothetical protein n=1 Tax=Fodinicurvata halophila TaxID=1419723 RepID=UPI00362DBDDE
MIVLPIEEAPGDGRESLEIAMMQVLRDAGVPVRRVPEKQDFLLDVDIDLGTPQDGSQRIRILWTLLSARDFSEIGTLTQENRIPAGSLDGEWGDTAYLISRAAAEGLIELFRSRAWPLHPGNDTRLEHTENDRQGPALTSHGVLPDAHQRRVCFPPWKMPWKR